MGTIQNPLEFEREIVTLESELADLQDLIASGDESKRQEYASLEVKVAKLRREVYGKLSSHQRVQLSRHFDRPFTLDYIKYLISDFVEFHGDRLYADDPGDSRWYW